MSIYPESVLRLRRLADRVVGVDGGAVSIYLESVSRLRRLALVERVVGMGWVDGGAVSIPLHHPESGLRLRRLAK